jgi:RNA polymerase sigma factor (sigma-70 family)
MTALTPHLAQTLVEDRLRGAEQARIVRGAAPRGSLLRRRLGRRNQDALDVVTAAARGDESAWALLQERYGKRVRGIARSYRLSPQDVDDVVQATWLRLVENIGRVREPGAVGAWLETTARRECLSALRRRERETPAEEVLIEQSCEPVDEQRLVAAERHTALASGLARLPRRQRRLIAAMLVEPAPSYTEIAVSLEMPIGSIGPTRARTLARLRKDAVLAGAVAETAHPQTREG